MRTLIFVLLFVCPPAIKPWLLRTFCGAQVARGARIGWLASVSARRIALAERSEIRPLTLIRCDGELSLGAYAIISSFNLVYGSAGLRLGEHSYIGPQCLINCDEDVSLGRYSALGARCMVFTHGSFLPYTEGYWVRFGPVHMGDYVWCAAGVFVHPGTSVGDNVFVNSRGVISGAVPSGAVMEGNPARQSTTVERLRRSVSPRRLDAIAGQMLDHFAEVGLRRAHAIAAERSPAGLRFALRGRPYAVLLVPSAGEPPTLPAGARPILLVSRPGYPPPPGVPVLDLASNIATLHGDRVAHELAVFLQRYYGVQLREAPPKP